jgi:hypothetical protein
MSTDTVPGADPKNRDKLARGCWAEHEDGSLIYVKDIDENDRVIYEIYDFKDPGSPVYYPHAMPLKEFEKTFSYDPKKKAADTVKWTWHDKTPMPWDKVMRQIERPYPVLANVGDNFTAAQRMAESLQLRVAEALSRKDVLDRSGVTEEPVGSTAKTIWGKLKHAVGGLRP